MFGTDDRLGHHVVLLLRAGDDFRPVHGGFWQACTSYEPGILDGAEVHPPPDCTGA